MILDLNKQVTDQNYHEFKNPDIYKKELSPREKEIVELLAMGLSGKDIANKLQISYTTVRNTLTSVYGKLNIDHSGQLIVAYYLNEIPNMEPVTVLISKDNL